MYVDSSPPLAVTSDGECNLTYGVKHHIHVERNRTHRFLCPTHPLVCHRLLLFMPAFQKCIDKERSPANAEACGPFHNRHAEQAFPCPHQHRTHHLVRLTPLLWTCILNDSSNAATPLTVAAYTPACTAVFAVAASKSVRRAATAAAAASTSTCNWADVR